MQHSRVKRFVIVVALVFAVIGGGQLNSTTTTAQDIWTDDILYSCLDSGAYAETWDDWAEAIAWCAGVPVAVVWDFLQFVLCPGDFKDGYWDDGPTC